MKTFSKDSVFRNVLMPFVLFYSSCRAGINIDRFLNSVGFDNPVNVQCQLIAPIYLQSQATSNSNFSLPLVTLLMKAGYLSIVPDVNAEPWWQYQATRGTLNGQWFNAPVAKRRVLSRTNNQDWDEGSIKYHAETIQYEIFFDNKIKEISHVGPLKNSFRLVLVFDPAVGDWAVYQVYGRGTNFSGATDNSAVTDLLTVSPSTDVANGVAPLEYLLQRIDSAAHYSDNIEANKIFSSGILVRQNGNDSIIISNQNKLAYYAPIHAFPSNTTLKEVRKYCSDLNYVLEKYPYHDWRIPTLTEMSTLMVGNRMIDTPHRIIWGSISGEEERSKIINWDYRFITDTYYMSGRNNIVDHMRGVDEPGQWANFYYKLYRDGRMERDEDFFGDKNTDQLKVGGSIPPARVICIASFGPAPEVDSNAVTQPVSSDTIVEEQKTKNTTPFSELEGRYPDARYFPRHSYVFNGRFSQTWEKIVQLLAEQKETMSTQDKENGILTTQITEHGFFLIASHLQFIMKVDPQGDGNTVVTYKILRYSQPTQQGRVGLQREMNESIIQFQDTKFMRALEAKLGESISD